jgi:hypothetical protein
MGDSAVVLTGHYQEKGNCIRGGSHRKQCKNSKGETKKTAAATVINKP